MSTILFRPVTETCVRREEIHIYLSGCSVTGLDNLDVTKRAVRFLLLDNMQHHVGIVANGSGFPKVIGLVKLGKADHHNFEFAGHYLERAADGGHLDLPVYIPCRSSR